MDVFGSAHVETFGLYYQRHCQMEFNMFRRVTSVQASDNLLFAAIWIECVVRNCNSFRSFLFLSVFHFVTVCAEIDLDFNFD